MNILLLAIALLPRQDAKIDDYFKHDKATKWEYAQTEKGAVAERVELEIQTVKDGTTTLSSREFEVDAKEPKKSETLAWVKKEGFLIWAEVKGGKVISFFKLYKEGSKKGDTWDAKANPDIPPIQATHKGTEVLTVPAGTYKDAVHIQLEMKIEFGGKQQVTTIDVYFAKGVGLLKFEGKQNGKTTKSMVLREVKKP